MAKSTVSKPTATKAPSTKTVRPKRGPGAENGGSSENLGSSFAVPSDAFTVETYEDPGPKRSRYSFGKSAEILQIPDLIELQKASFKWFTTDGLREAFSSISPIKDFTGNLVLEFGDHSLGELQRAASRTRSLNYRRIGRNQGHS